MTTAEKKGVQAWDTDNMYDTLRDVIIRNELVDVRMLFFARNLIVLGKFQGSRIPEHEYLCFKVAPNTTKINQDAVTQILTIKVGSSVKLIWDSLVEDIVKDLNPVELVTVQMQPESGVSEELLLKYFKTVTPEMIEYFSTAVYPSE